MKIKSLLLVIDNIHFGGGGERVACNICNHYVTEGTAVEIVSFGAYQQKVVFDLNNSVKIHYFDAEKNKIVQKFVEYFKLKRFLKTHKYDVTMAIGCSPSVILGMVSNGSFVSIGTEHLHYFDAPKIWNAIRKIAYPRLSSLAVLTHHDLPYVQKINPKACVIPNALPSMPEKKVNINNKVFLAVGRLTPVKQFSQMISIMKEFVEYNKDWELHIIGKGEQREQLMDMVSQYNLDNYVKILPYSNDMESVYLSASVLLSTSRSEGLPMTMLEAQSYGMPIVAYDCLTGPSEIVNDRKNGFLIQLDDEDKMLKVLLKIADDNKLRQDMSENAIKDSYRFSSEMVYQKWDTLFVSLIN